MTTINAPFLNAVRSEIEAALAPIAEKYGIAIKAGSASYVGDGSNGTMKITLAKKVQAADGSTLAMTREAANLRVYSFIGWNPDCFGKQFQWNAETYTVVGYSPKSRKYPVLAKNERDGKTYKLPERALTTYFPPTPKEREATCSRKGGL